MSAVSSHTAGGDDSAQRAVSPASGLLDHLPSAFFTPQHEKFRRTVRAFVERHLDAHTIDECERTGLVPRSLLQASYAAGFYAMRAPVELGGTPPPQLNPGQRADSFYEFLLVDELSACGAHGLVTELIGNFGMLLPILNTFATDAIRQTIVLPMIRADLFVCFAFTEPPPPEGAAKSPVAPKRPIAPSGPRDTKVPSSPRPRSGGPPRLRTTATRCADGSFEITGDKLYISFAARSDYIIVACTIKPAPGVEATAAAPGPAALSLILVPSRQPGVTIENMPLHGWHSTSTTRISFRGVHVPANLLLVDGSSSSLSVMQLLFSLLQSNVNQERYVTAVMAHRSARVCLEDAITFARQKRIGPDRRLSDSPAVRQQLVQMAALVQQNQHLLEALTAHRVQADASSTTSTSESTDGAARPSAKALAQQIALAKYSCGKALTHCAHTASVICGSAVLARGSRIERLMRDGPVNAAAGGGESALLEFVAKQAKL